MCHAAIIGIARPLRPDQIYSLTRPHGTADIAHAAVRQAASRNHGYAAFRRTAMISTAHAPKDVRISAIRLADENYSRLIAVEMPCRTSYVRKETKRPIKMASNSLRLTRMTKRGYCRRRLTAASRHYPVSYRTAEPNRPSIRDRQKATTHN